jgi:hypothetical protein
LYRIEHPQYDIAERVPVKDEPRRGIKINDVIRIRTTTVANRWPA